MEDKILVKEKKCPVGLIVLLALVVLLLILTNVYLISGTVNALDDDGIGLAAFFVFGVIILGFSGNLASFILALVGLILSIFKNKKINCKWQIITFSVLTALPVLSQVTFIIIFALL